MVYIRRCHKKLPPSDSNKVSHRGHPKNATVYNRRTVTRPTDLQNESVATSKITPKRLTLPHPQTEEMDCLSGKESSSSQLSDSVEISRLRAGQKRLSRSKRSRDESSSDDGEEERHRLIKSAKVVGPEVISSCPGSRETCSTMTQILPSSPSTPVKGWVMPPKPDGYDDGRLADEPKWDEIWQPIPKHHKFVHVLNHFKAWNK